MGKFLRVCCRREMYAGIVGCIYLIFEVLALATPWYAIGATQMPDPWDSMTGIFYWGGYEGVYAPPLILQQRTYNIGWAQMVSTLPKDVYMTSMAMTFLGIFSMLLLIGLLFFGFVLPRTERIIQIMFFGWFKWIVVIVCYANFGVSLIAWTIFFAFNNALHHADICPGSKSYNPAPFPYHNTTTQFEPLWCDSFANNRFSYELTTQWVWGPSIGWIFSIVGFVLSMFILFICLSIPTRNTSDKEYERIK